MTYTVTVTSQGQISIPAPIRRQFNLDHVKRVTVTVMRDSIVVRPARDIENFLGIFKTKKRLSRKQELKLLEEGWAKGWV